MRAVTFVEIDIPYCDLIYGTAPCSAEIGVTGTRKCFNTRKTCQDIAAFDPSPLTLRFATASSTLDPQYAAIPSLLSVATTPAVIDPGVSMGERESVSCTFLDHPDSDALFDKYLDDRGYNPFLRGTFWGRFRARVTSPKGLAVRVIRGEQGEAIGDMETRHYVGETMNGPRGDRFVIIAKDALKLLDGDRAQAPALSNGELQSDIDDTTTTATLTPAGIGDAEYPATGKISIGKKEIVSFTRSGDALTIVRGESNTEPTSHDAGELMQLVLIYDSESAADIIYDLLTTYTNVESAWLPLADWQEDIDEWIGRLYSAEIAEPTAVKDLVNELIEQVGLVSWWDPVGQRVRLTALRPVTSSAPVYDLDRIMQGSYSASDQPKKRISQAWTFFNLINPLEPIDDSQNYQSAVALVDPDNTEPEYDDQPAINKVFSRWIGQFNRPAASRLNSLKLARYQVAPRAFAWAVYQSDSAPELGRGARIRHSSLQDDTGEQVTVPVQVTSVEVSDDRYKVTAEEMAFAGEAEGDRIVIIDVDAYNINLRELYDQFYQAPSSYDNVLFIVEEGTNVGGAIGGGNSGSAQMQRGISIDVGEWPESPQITLRVNGGVYGRGGQGGDGFTAGIDGGVGGTGLYTRVPITIENYGAIAGGGGGGGGTYGGDFEFRNPSGGGGAGFEGGAGGNTTSSTGLRGDDGTIAGGGLGGSFGTKAGGNGGTLGAAGEQGINDESGDEGSGGGAGYAIDGSSFVTWSPMGTVSGPTVN